MPLAAAIKKLDDPYLEVSNMTKGADGQIRRMASAIKKPDETNLEVSTMTLCNEQYGSVFAGTKTPPAVTIIRTC